MNRRRCERVWQAEAREDGRLEQRDLASFERHLAHCRDCSAEVTALRDIAKKMATLPERERTDLEHRRARNELLRRANEQFLTAKPTTKPWKTWALAGAMVLGSSGFLWHRTVQHSPRVPRFDVVDVTNAVWQTETNHSTSKVTLKSGTAAFHVEHLEKEGRFLVHLPDGQIEVRGTRFVVEVHEGKTNSVKVTEGIVWLDVPTFHGLVHAGERWPKLEAAAAIPASSAEAKVGFTAPNDKPEPSQAVEDATIPTTPGPQAKGIFENTPAPVVSAESSNDTPPTSNSAVVPKDDAGPRFAEAMAAFTSGDNTRADQLFAAFIRDFPRDGRAEDAMFLRAKVRARQGDAAGAAAMAEAYLKTFPRGFRRPEAERLAAGKK